MSEVLLDLFRRYSSRKFLAAGAAFTIVLLDGLGAAEFTAEVLAIASTGLVAYIGAEATGDAITRMKKK
ncbi:MAG: hypothetical protein V3U27_21440 [Candidatus Tectomicrobia bacterium]